MTTSNDTTDRTRAEQDAIEARLRDGLIAWAKHHDPHCGPEGVTFYRDGEDERFPRHLHRQAVYCDSCAACYVGPSYSWLNRGVTLTHFGALVAKMAEVSS